MKRHEQIKEKESSRTLARVRDDTGPNGYWARKEAGKKDWFLRADLSSEGAAPQRRLRQKYTRNIKHLLKNGETP